MSQEPGTGVEEQFASVRPEQGPVNFEQMNNQRKLEQATAFVKEDLTRTRFADELKKRSENVSLWDQMEVTNKLVEEKKAGLTELERKALGGDLTVEEAERVGNAFRAKANLMHNIKRKELPFFKNWEIDTYGLTEEEVGQWNIEQVEVWVKQKNEELSGDAKIKFQETINNHSQDPGPIVYKDEEDYLRLEKVLHGEHGGNIKRVHTESDGSHFVETEMHGPIGGYGGKLIGEAIPLAKEGRKESIRTYRDPKTGKEVEMGENQEKRIWMVAVALSDMEEEKQRLFPWIQADFGDAGGIGIHFELYGNEPLTPNEQDRYDKLKQKEKQEQEERKKREKVMKIVSESEKPIRS